MARLLRERLPYVSVNMAMSLDGKASTVSREPARFSSSRDKALLLELRSRADAVMAGGGTVANDSMSLGITDSRLRKARERRGLPAQPVRVVVSGTLQSLRPSLRVFQKKISPIILFCSARAPEKLRRIYSRHAIVVVCGESRVDLRKAAGFLARYFGVRHLHAEGGPELNGSLLEAGLIDELNLTLVGVVFGGRGAPTVIEGAGCDWMAESQRMNLVSIRLSGGEVYLRYVRRVASRSTFQEPRPTK